MLNHLIKKNDLVDIFNSYGLDEKKIKFIGRLIIGKPSPGVDDPSKNYLFEVSIVFLLNCYF